MQMTYNYICFLLIHHQVSICNSQIVRMILKYGLYLIIFSLMHPKTAFLNLSQSLTYFHSFLNDNIVIFYSPTFLHSSYYAITKAANYHLFRIRKMRKSITISLTKTLVNSIVLSRIDYCSSILVNLPLSSISPLNLVIRSTIRITYDLRIQDHSSTSSYQHLPPRFPFNKRYAYRILSIIYYSIYSSNYPPIFLLL